MTTGICREFAEHFRRLAIARAVVCVVTQVAFDPQADRAAAGIARWPGPARGRQPRTLSTPRPQSIPGKGLTIAWRPSPLITRKRALTCSPATGIANTSVEFSDRENSQGVYIRTGDQQ